MNPIFGSLEFTGTDLSWPGVKCDRLALNATGGLVFASILADTGIIKGIRGLLNSDKRAFINAKGIKVQGTYAYGKDTREPGGIGKIEGGYQIEAHRLDYGLAHAFITTRSAGFMTGASDSHLWAKLTEPHFTTPILPEWIGYVGKWLREHDRLADAQTYRCDCAILTATVKDVDAAVSAGLASGRIGIPARPAHALKLIA